MSIRLKAINEAISILKLAGYTLNNSAYTALVKEKGELEGALLRQGMPDINELDVTDEDDYPDVSSIEAKDFDDACGDR